MLFRSGSLKINNYVTLPENHFALFKHDGEDFEVEALDETVALILSGEPINEPIASYGPFVMNTREEIKKAYEDYYNGDFGHLED